MSARVWLAIFVSMLMLSFTSPVNADKPSEGCSFLGSWIGFNPAGDAYFTSTAEGSNSAFGTYNLEVLMEPSFVGAIFPGATDYTEFRGVWKRIDGYSFELSVISIVFDADHQTVGIAKLRGVDTLNLTCDTMTIQMSLDVFDPDVNPFEDEYKFSIPMPTHEAHRMTIP